MKKRDLTDEEEIKKSIALGEYVCKGKNKTCNKIEKEGFVFIIFNRMDSYKYQFHYYYLL